MGGLKHTRPKGTQDFIPPESARLRQIETVARSLCERYGFQEIVTPVFEHTEVYVKSSGSGSDIVTKEMYSFKDRAGRDLTLRPEGTPGVVRAVLENYIRVPCRLYYIGPHFRYGRPQKGRYREFRQLGVEALGEAHPMVDAELIRFGVVFFQELGITDCLTQLTSIGCRVCRPAYRDKLVMFLVGHQGELCPDCRLRLERNPLRVFDCKVETCRIAVADAPKPAEYLCPECQRHHQAVMAALRRWEVRFEVNDRLVRGLDYYNRTTFEYISTRLGAQDSLGGGGRYDYLVADFGGPETPAVGLAIGLERTLLATPESSPAVRRKLVFVVWLAESELDAAVRVLDRLRAAGIPAQIDFDARKPKHQFRSADAAGAACCVIVGPDELARGSLSVKNLETGEQLEVPQNTVVEQVRSFLR
ncbi:MAG: histidine--tRNA ligase [candidate division WOR-3 bacterium]